MSKEGRFTTLLTEQVQHEFAASQQYVAIAVWFDSNDLPRLAAQFYQHSLGERNHAMMIVQYMLDRDIRIPIPTIPEVRNDFSSPLDALQFSLEQEEKVTSQIEALFTAAREEKDPLGEQFCLWFLREQVEEVAHQSTMVNIATRAGDNWFDIEQYLARDTQSATNTGTPPAVAGGAL